MLACATYVHNTIKPKIRQATEETKRCTQPRRCKIHTDTHTCKHCSWATHQTTVHNDSLTLPAGDDHPRRQAFRLMADDVFFVSARTTPEHNRNTNTCLIKLLPADGITYTLPTLVMFCRETTSSIRPPYLFNSAHAVDTTRWMHTRCYGHCTVRTPSNMELSQA